MRMTRARRLGLTGLALLGLSLPARSAEAVTTLNVDLSTPLGPVTHAASGSLYGVIETRPADVTGLIAPLHPRMFNNPASDVQQPVGDAIVVAGRVAPIGAQVTIRLADWFTGFYTFTNMTDWFTKIGETVTRRQAANLTNIYAYEIWNEPNGTWASTNPLTFNQFWMETFAQLRKLDPTIKITGPSANYYDQAYISSLLTFCKTNNCLPDIVGWHELEGADLTTDIQNYRALEKQLGIGPLPISINEYSGAGHINVEGQPGASAPLIAKFERFRVDSACISFWDVANPGRLGSLLATSTATNGGWWFYKWYGDMAGTMVSTTPPTPTSPTVLDGFANLDASGKSASILFGGTNDGTVQIVVKGFHAAAFFGATVHAEIDHTPFVNRTTPVTATDVLSSANVAVTGDQITITVNKANATDGYRLLITPVGGGAVDAGIDSGSTTDAGRGDATVEGDAATADASLGSSSAGSSGTGPDAATASSSGSGTTGTAGGSSTGTASTGTASGSSSGTTGTGSGGGSSSGISGAATPSEDGAIGGSDQSAGCSCGVAIRSGNPASLAALGLVSLLVARRKRGSRKPQ
jgi:hypothetical protein